MIGLMKGELGRRIMKEIIALRPEMYNYLTDDRCVDKKAKGTIKGVIKPEMKNNCLKNIVWKCFKVPEK